MAKLKMVKQNSVFRLSGIAKSKVKLTNVELRKARKLFEKKWANSDNYVTKVI